MADTPAQINALVTRQGVNMGDHAQDVTQAVAVLPGETVEAFLRRVLPKRGWPEERDPDAYVTLRLVEVPRG